LTFQHHANDAQHFHRADVFQRAAELKAIYQAVNADAAEAALDEFEQSVWGQKYPPIVQAWRRQWTQLSRLRAKFLNADNNFRSSQLIAVRRSFPDSVGNIPIARATSAHKRRKYLKNGEGSRTMFFRGRLSTTNRHRPPNSRAFFPASARNLLNGFG
jgi:transposase-like protein